MGDRPDTHWYSGRESNVEPTLLTRVAKLTEPTPELYDCGKIWLVLQAWKKDVNPPNPSRRVIWIENVSFFADASAGIVKGIRPRSSS